MARESKLPNSWRCKFGEHCLKKIASHASSRRSDEIETFLNGYENIQSGKEWQEVLDATMQNFLIMKELVDYYSGPNMVTANKGMCLYPKICLSAQATVKAKQTLPSQ